MNEDVQGMWDLSKATYLIKTRLRHLKAFIVLDNVDKDEQLEKLGLNHECLCAGSRIIITSRDQQILNNYGVDEVYDAQLLSNDEARQLFCRKAFKCDYIISCDDISREYKVLTNLALEYAQCLPLVIKVLGSFLYGKNASEWRSSLDRLRDNPNKDIMGALQTSFDGLEPIEQEIFLDIACFFSGHHEKFVKNVLGCRGFHPNIGIRVLIDKSLITISSSIISMHDKLRELGMKIVRQKAPNRPGKWTRLWLQEDFYNVMYEKMAMNNLEAICLSSEEHGEVNTTLRAEALSKMNQLRLLRVDSVNFSGSLKGLSTELQYLSWEDYPFTYFPSSCELTKLVELSLPSSNIKQLWEGVKLMGNLKIMDLYHSRNLVKTPDFSGTPNLEWLHLGGCTRLERIHPSIGHLRKLVYLNLEDCTSLMSHPKSIFSVISLEVLNLQGCSKLFHRQLLELMSPFHFFNSARHNDIVGLMMPSLPRLDCLRELDLSSCNLLYIPVTIPSLRCLERLLLKGNNFVTLPYTITELPRLIYLNLDNCKHLTSLPKFPLRTVLPVENDHVYRAVAGLYMLNCPKLVERQSWGSIALSWMIQFLKEHKECTPPINIVIPGTQICSWFNHQSMGDSLRIELNKHDSNWIGLAFCAAFVTHCVRPSSYGTHIVCVIKDGNGMLPFRVLAEIVKTGGATAELDHLWLQYFTRQELINDEDIIKRTLDFKLKLLDNAKCFQLEVQNYGMRLIFKQDLEELNGDE